jgi:hypothetical protein
MSDDHLRYPTGKFTPQDTYTASELASYIQRIETFPARLKTELASLAPSRLDTPYRDGGWTARQVIHHLADSHMNAYIRFKWTLTEDSPLIKAYDEKAWAETVDTRLDPVISVQLLIALHAKLTELLKRISPEQLKREFTHPETKKQISIERMIATYAWDGDHHLGHIKIIAAKSKS